MSNEQNELKSQEIKELKEKCDQLVEKIQRLLEELSRANQHHENAASKLWDCEQENHRLREALEVYASRSMWANVHDPNQECWFTYEDLGETARRALAGNDNV